MVKLEIVLEDDGRLQVSGPIQDKILCYGMLELAKTVVTAHKQENKIVAVPPGAKLVDMPTRQ
jgi:hypothetical protein